MTDWKPATAQQIQEYYQSTFPSLVDQLPDWITPAGPHQFALSFRESYPVNYDGFAPKQFLRRDTRNEDNPDIHYFDSWEDVIDFIQQPASNDPLRINTDNRRGLKPPSETNWNNNPVPEAVYYSLDNWDTYWVLAFDIDAKDVAKERIAGPNESFEDISDEALEDAGVISNAPTPASMSSDDATMSPDGNHLIVPYKYEFPDLDQAITYAFDLAEFLESTIGFEDTLVVYSGQGAHVYARSTDPYDRYTLQSRRVLTTYIKERLHIPIDDAITWDKNRVIRLPYTLHADVSRVVMPINDPDFDVKNGPVPGRDEIPTPSQ